MTVIPTVTMRLPILVRLECSAMQRVCALRRPRRIALPPLCIFPWTHGEAQHRGCGSLGRAKVSAWGCGRQPRKNCHTMHGIFALAYEPVTSLGRTIYYKPNSTSSPLCNGWRWRWFGVAHLDWTIVLGLLFATANEQPFQQDLFCMYLDTAFHDHTPLTPSNWIFWGELDCSPCQAADWRIVT